MNEEQRKHLENRLRQQRQRAVKALALYDESLSASGTEDPGDLQSYTFHMADQGTDTMEREKAFLFASKEGRLLYHTDQALRRLYQTPALYGLCEECKSPINLERLDALPHARLCIDCKQREESGD